MTGLKRPSRQASDSRLRQVALFGDDLERFAQCAGVDEAGRGPLAGDVYAAAVILDPAHPITGLADSKTLSEAMRSLGVWQVQVSRKSINSIFCKRQCLPCSVRFRV
jgi:hypothetical protein